MDTMQLGLILKEGLDYTRKDQDELERKINNITSPTGRMFCDVMKFSRKSSKIIIKVSFPRYFYGNNAYLVETSKECLKVQKTLVKELNKIFNDNIVSIDLERLDIPFTYLVDKDREFTDYNNIYKIGALVFGKGCRKSISKSIIDTITEMRETIIYSDSKCISAYNKKVIIYDQYLNLETKLDDYEFEKTVKKFPNLERRMRIEVASRIKRNSFTLERFKKYDFFKEYSRKYKEFLLEKLFNLDKISDIYEEQISVLSSKLEEYRENKGKKFSYEKFIMSNIKKIYDYEILRGALKDNIKNHKTRENGITIVRGILRELEEEDRLKIIGVRKEIKEIAKTIKRSFVNVKRDVDFDF